MSIIFMKNLDMFLTVSLRFTDQVVGKLISFVYTFMFNQMSIFKQEVGNSIFNKTYFNNRYLQLWKTIFHKVVFLLTWSVVQWLPRDGSGCSLGCQHWETETSAEDCRKSPPDPHCCTWRSQTAGPETRQKEKKDN